MNASRKPEGSGTGVLVKLAVIRTLVESSEKRRSPSRSIEMLAIGLAKFGSHIGALLDTHEENVPCTSAGTIALGFGPDGQITSLVRVEISPLPENTAVSVSFPIV